MALPCHYLGPYPWRHAWPVSTRQLAGSKQQLCRSAGPTKGHVVQGPQAAGGWSALAVVPVEPKAAQVPEPALRKHTKVVPLHDRPVAATRATQVILYREEAQRSTCVAGIFNRSATFMPGLPESRGVNTQASQRPSSKWYAGWRTSLHVQVQLVAGMLACGRLTGTLCQLTQARWTGRPAAGC